MLVCPPYCSYSCLATVFLPEKARPKIASFKFNQSGITEGNLIGSSSSYYAET